MTESSSPATDPAPARPPVVVKKYANRRLYNTETSSYITLDNLADMVRLGRDFVVFDAKSGDDITRGVLTQIIVEEESKGSSLLPTNFLRQLIGFYGDSLQGVVPRYLESAMSNFARQQQQMRQVMQQTFSPFLPMGVPMSVDDISRQNIALMERAMSMFNPFARPTEPHATHTEAEAETPSTAVTPDVAALRNEVESLRAQLAIAQAEAVVSQAVQKAAAARPAALPVLSDASLNEHITATTNGSAAAGEEMAKPNLVLPGAVPPNVLADTAAAAPLSVARKVRTARKPS